MPTNIETLRRGVITDEPETQRHGRTWDHLVRSAWIEKEAATKKEAVPKQDGPGNHTEITGAEVMPKTHNVNIKRLPHNKTVPQALPDRQCSPDQQAAEEIMEGGGNIIRREWTHNLRLPGGGADTVAALVLGEVVYWCRPSPDGHRKFSGDILQKDYGQLAKSLGITPRQAKDAVLRLEEAGVLRREFRTLTVHGRLLSHLLHLVVIPSGLKRVSGPPCDVKTSDATPGASDAEPNPCDAVKLPSDVLPSDARPPTSPHVTADRQTCTESTQRAPQREEKPQTPCRGKGLSFSSPVPDIHSDYPASNDPTFPKTKGHRDYGKAIELHDSRAGEFFDTLVGTDWRKSSALTRMFVARRMDGQLPDRLLLRLVWLEQKFKDVRALLTPGKLQELSDWSRERVTCERSGEQMWLDNLADREISLAVLHSARLYVEVDGFDLLTACEGRDTPVGLVMTCARHANVHAVIAKHRDQIWENLIEYQALLPLAREADLDLFTLLGWTEAEITQAQHARAVELRSKIEYYNALL